MTMTKSIYVGNLPFNASEKELRDLFSPYGDIASVRLVTDKETGRSRGFGFIEMAESGAASAIEALNGKDLEGRALRINEAQPRAERPPKRW
jgi:RNA recognition motif-containing protein